MQSYISKGGILMKKQQETDCKIQQMVDNIMPSANIDFKLRKNNKYL